MSNKKPEYVLGLQKMGEYEDDGIIVRTSLTSEELAYAADVRNIADQLQELLESQMLSNYNYRAALDLARDISWAHPTRPDCEGIDSCRICVNEFADEYEKCERVQYLAGRIALDVFDEMARRGFKLVTIDGYDYVANPDYEGDYETIAEHGLIPTESSRRARHHLDSAKRGVFRRWEPES